MFDRYIISTDDKIGIDAVPYFIKTWKHFYGKPISLGIILSEDESIINPTEFSKYDYLKYLGIESISFFPNKKEIPIYNQIVLSRYYLSFHYLNEICLLTDCNNIIGSKEYLPKKLKDKITVKVNEYDDLNILDNYTTEYIIGKGKDLMEIMNPLNLLYFEFLDSFYEIKNKLFSEYSTFYTLATELKLSNNIKILYKDGVRNNVYMRIPVSENMDINSQIINAIENFVWNIKNIFYTY